MATAKRMISHLLLWTALGLALGGCWAPRSETYRQLQERRNQAYLRWAEQSDHDKSLPRIQGELSLEDALKLALTYNTSLAMALEEKRKARGTVLEAYGEALPNVDLTAEYRRLDEVAAISAGPVSFSVGDKDNYSVTLNITQPLYKGGAVSKGIRAARLYSYMRDEGIRQAVQEVVHQTARAYYDVLLAERLLEVLEDSQRFAEANLRDVTARMQAGAAIRFDVLRAQVEVSNVSADLIRQRNLLERARTALFKAMGVSQRSDVKLTDQLQFVPVTAELDSTVEAAFKNRPELYNAELNLDFQQTALEGYYSRYLPTLEAFGFQKWAKPDPHDSSDISWGDQWQAGLRLKWTLFDGLRREGLIVQQKASVRQAAIALAEQEQRILQEAADAVLAVRDAEELVKSQQRNLERAQEALRLVQVGAREGVNTELQVLDARSALTRAQGLYYEALHSHCLARLGLQRAMGLLATAPGDQQVPPPALPAGALQVIAKPAGTGAAAESPAEAPQQ